MLTRAARATEAGQGSTSSAACSPVRSMGFPSGRHTDPTRIRGPSPPRKIIRLQRHPLVLV
jgi:hypothetical protein